MDGSEWRPTRWTPAQLEERRLAAAALLRQGRLTQAAIARRLSVSRAGVGRWSAVMRRKGRHGPRARPKAGRPPRLDARAWARLGRLPARGAVAAGFETERWTPRRRAAPVLREFGVRHHPRHLERPPKAHGLTARRPATRAKECDGRTRQGARRAHHRRLAAARVGGWRSKEKARREGRTLLLRDETGHGFRQRPGTTRARRGVTPVLRRVSRRREVSGVVAVTPDGRLHARHFRGGISGRRAILALRHSRRKAG